MTEIAKLRTVGEVDSTVWEAQAAEPVAGELPAHMEWLVFTSRKGIKRRASILRSTLPILSIEDVRMPVARAKGTRRRCRDGDPAPPLDD